MAIGSGMGKRGKKLAHGKVPGFMLAKRTAMAAGLGKGDTDEAQERPARNAPCPCGVSGKKFKHCCANKAVYVNPATGETYQREGGPLPHPLPAQGGRLADLLKRTEGGAE